MCLCTTVQLFHLTCTHESDLNYMESDFYLHAYILFTDDKIRIEWSTEDKCHSGYINTEWLKSNNYSRPVLERHNAAMEPTTVAVS